MDVIVNSNVQSPLVRTLARTKTKTESFTQHLKDNVPPVSISKIKLNPEGGQTGAYNRNYKFKIPQYGYLRNATLQFSSKDLPIKPALIEYIYTQLSNMNYNGLGLLGVPRRPSSAGVGQPANVDHVANNSGTAGDKATTLLNGPNSFQYMFHAYVPYEEGYYAVEQTSDPFAQMWLRIHGGRTLDSLTSSYAAGPPVVNSYPPQPSIASGVGPTAATSGNIAVAAVGAARICPFRYDVRDNITTGDVMQQVQWSTPGIARDGGYYPVTESTNTQLHGVPQYKSNSGNMKRWMNGARVHNTWDWCTQSNLSQLLGAIIPSVVTLSTHNRPIQTIYPLESLARIFNMPGDKKNKYLSMIRPHLTASPSQCNTVRSQADAYGTDRMWTCYLPLFLSFFEEPSMNLDTRFVENLELDVTIRADTDIYWSADLGDQAANLPVLGVASTPTLFQDAVTSCSGLTDGPYNSVTFRRMCRVVDTVLDVNCIVSYYNFHDTTSQSIRDANYKPNIPANLLTYNTYFESPVSLSAATILGGGSVTINLSCNNLVFEMIVMVRRKAHLNAQKHELSAFQDFAQTLPIKDITLQGSGQQLYTATGVECLLVDQIDSGLSTFKNGGYGTNSSSLYADNMASSHVTNKTPSNHFFAYHLKFGMTTDYRYNSGAMALQSINNPTITINFHPLDGWVIQDTSLAVKNASFFNRNTQLGHTAIASGLVQDNEFEVLVFENYWQMTRIDSNTGAITKSLDL